ncbi:MAG TPA: adenylate/guanylate cyclase domain-containing protein, partial [Candidatus Baltobacteraceae bacterium]|nr:adenylate/guanylate cyclase domain-containing protein [Candidatus Baltobacteraceae bacterium]
MEWRVRQAVETLGTFMNLPSGTVTFLFTDIQGSTVRWERYREAMRVAVQRHDALVREAVQTHGGVVFKTVGDELCAAFSNALDAIAAALAAQRGLHAADFSAVGGLSSRMGIHAGTVQASDGDYLGPPLNRVARLMALAHGEQIVLSRVVADLVDGELPPDTSLRDLGPHRLEGIASAEQVYQLVAPDLRSGFPPLRAGGATPGNLPVSVASLVGRSAEVAEIEQLLDASRLITIVGSGGVGKSSIALHVAREKRSQYR